MVFYSCVLFMHSISFSFKYLSVFLFFFSSRRRHTRWPRDWSSDVCSSDLEPLPVVDAGGSAPGVGDDVIVLTDRRIAEGSAAGRVPQCQEHPQFLGERPRLGFHGAQVSRHTLCVPDPLDV